MRITPKSDSDDDTTTAFTASSRVDKTLLAVRLFLILTAVPTVYWLVFSVMSTLFSLYGIAWMPHTIALLISAELAWVIWTRAGWLLGSRGK